MLAHTQSISSTNLIDPGRSFLNDLSNGSNVYTVLPIQLFLAVERLVTMFKRAFL